MKIGFSPLTGIKDLDAKGALIVAVGADQRLGKLGSALDKKTGGRLTRAMDSSRFSGKAKETLAIPAPAGLDNSRLLLIGLGKGEQPLTTLEAEELGAAACAALSMAGDAEAHWIVEGPERFPALDAATTAQIANGVLLRDYRFDKYRTREPKEKKPTLKRMTFLCADPAAAKKAFQTFENIASGIFLTRDLVSEPANIIYPGSLAQRCKSLEEAGVKVEILDEKQLARLGMGSLLAVAQGSVNPARVVVMQYNGGPKGKDAAPVAFVGKGVTFDTGGISIKPAAGMEDMKWDMAGAGAVIGVMQALAARKAHVNAVGVVGLVENMPSGSAQRPGDVVTSMSGQTIECLNTDAEGRMVLADAIWYTQERFKPHTVIDLATLTGAVIIALGHDYAGCFSNRDELASQLIAAGADVGEKLWRLPLGDYYDRLMDSSIADMQNISSSREAGSSTGAVFIQRFVKKETAWAHLDIAAMAWGAKDRGVTPKGATAYGVRLLDRFVARNFEGK